MPGNQKRFLWGAGREDSEKLTGPPNHRGHRAMLHYSSRVPAMTKNQIIGGLIGVLFVLAAVNAAFARRYASAMNNLRQMQVQVNAQNARVNLLQSLVNDTMEYSRRNPAIDPVLQSLGLKGNAA